MDAMDRDAGACGGKRAAVVIGGAGFIGSHLCARRLEQGFITLARSKRGWSPRVTLDIGLKRMIGWFDRVPSHLERPSEANNAIA